MAYFLCAQLWQRLSRNRCEFSFIFFQRQSKSSGTNCRLQFYSFHSSWIANFCCRPHNQLLGTPSWLQLLTCPWLFVTSPQSGGCIPFKFKYRITWHTYCSSILLRWVFFCSDKQKKVVGLSPTALSDAFHCDQFHDASTSMPDKEKKLSRKEFCVLALQKTFKQKYDMWDQICSVLQDPILSGLPYIVIFFTAFFSGLWADKLINRAFVPARIVRKIMQGVGRSLAFSCASPLSQCLSDLKLFHTGKNLNTNTYVLLFNQQT